jgi:hypothetical protein
LLNDEWVIDEIKEELKRFLEVNENENKTYQKLWDTAKAVLSGKFIAMNAYIKRTERSQINDLILPIKLLEKQEQGKLKNKQKGEITKVRAKINEIEMKKNTQRVKETKSCFFERINKIDRSLANLTKMRWGKTQVNEIRNAKGEITKDTTEIQGIIGDYFENAYSNEFKILKKMDKFVDTYDHPNLNQEYFNHLNISVT